MSNIKLTIERRKKIIESVIKGTLLPKRKEALKAATEAKVREALLKLLPKDFMEATKHLPREWFPHKASTRIRSDVHPMGIATYRTEEELRFYVSYRDVSFEAFRRPSNLDPEIASLEQSSPNAPKNKVCWELILKAEIEEAKKILDRETKVRTDLAAFLNSVTTYKQVLAKMPELERHLPDLPAKVYPVAVQVGPLVDLLDGLGFDQAVRGKK